MKMLILMLVLVLAGCAEAPEPEPAEPLTKPYAEKIEQLEQAQLQQAQHQLQAIDRQSKGKANEDES